MNSSESSTPSSESSYPLLDAKNRRSQLRISERRVVLVLGDMVMIVLAILISLRIWSWVAGDPFEWSFIAQQWGWFLFLPLLWFVLASVNDFYSLMIAANRWESLQRLIRITLQLLVVYVVIFFFFDRDALPRLFIFYYGVISFGLIIVWRLLNPLLIDLTSTPRRAIIVGSGEAAALILDVLSTHAPQSYRVMGIFGREVAPEVVDTVPHLRTEAALRDTLAQGNITELIVTSTYALDDDLFHVIMDAYERGIAITPMPLLYERLTHRVPVEHMGDNWAVVLPLSGVPALHPYRLLKRIMDVVLSLVGLLFFGLLLPFIAILQYLDSPGSIFYKQERVGLNGRRFQIIKLRTMIPDAEAKTGAVFAQKGDPRITRVGRFLRRTRLDEVPQLVNVLLGQMSLVGPRPERPQHIERLQQLIPFYRTRHTVRPGLTGWAQVRYRYGATDEDALVKLQYDLYYIRHQSLILDSAILVRTVGKVLTLGGQ